MQLHYSRRSCKIITIKTSGNEKMHTTVILAVTTLTIKLYPYEI